MPASEIRKDAREALTNKWGIGVCITLLYLLLAFILDFIPKIMSINYNMFAIIISFIIYIAISIISVPINFGLIISFMKLKRGENVSCFDFIKDGFSRFGKSWGIWSHIFLKLLLPILCIILSLFIITFLSISTNNRVGYAALSLLSTAIWIACLVYTTSRSLLYSLAYNISYDEPNLSSKDCVKKSETLMRGNRGNIFLLELSFIGWAILAALSLGIGFLWLYPYMQVALVCFYDKVIEIKEDKIEDAIITNE